MRHLGSGRLLSAVGVIAAALAAGAGGVTSPVLAGPVTTPQGPVSTQPAAGTPQLVKTGTVEKIRQLVQCGTMMYAVGSFTQISQGGKTFSRDNVFSFLATAPYTVSGWNVNVNGEVNSIAFTSAHGCADAYVGGSFTSVDGTPVTNIADVSTSTGAVISRFAHDANKPVDTLLGYQDHLLAGGQFTLLNGTRRHFYASLNPTSGKVERFVNLHISGKVPDDHRTVYNQQLSHSGNLLLAEGNFTSVGGQPRQQMFMLNLSGSTAKVTGWTSPEFNGHCVVHKSFYVHAAAWSPDDSTVYIATTGFHPLNRVKGSFPLTGLCDAAAAFPASQKSVRHTWVEYTGCDSYYSVAADDGAVYVGGHQRWAQNPNGCDFAGKGAMPDPGLQGLDPSNGTLETSGGAPVYSSSKANADDMLITSAGLWIASTNRFSSQVCDGASGHSGICFLPYA